jgi:hypothetical protein
MFNSVQQHIQQITQQNQLFGGGHAVTSVSNAVNDAKQRKLENTLLVLRALGVEFIIKTPDGQMHEHGSLQLQQPAPAKPARKKRIVTAPHGTYTSILEASGFNAMEIGDLLVIDPQGYNPESLRSTASSRASRAWGLGSLTTEVTNGKLEALRVK